MHVLELFFDLYYTLAFLFFDSHWLTMHTCKKLSETVNHQRVGGGNLNTGLAYRQLPTPKGVPNFLFHVMNNQLICLGRVSHSDKKITRSYPVNSKLPISVNISTLEHGKSICVEWLWFMNGAGDWIALRALINMLEIPVEIVIKLRRKKGSITRRNGIECHLYI